MKIFSLLISLFIFSCDDNPSEPTSCDIEINGVWNYTTVDTSYSDECVCPQGECSDYSIDWSCASLIIEDENATLDLCQCQNTDSDSCLDTTETPYYECNGSNITCGDCESSISIINENTISITVLGDGLEEGYNEGCIITDTLVLVRN